MKKITGVGLAATAAAAAAAGYYFYASKNAKKHRKIAAKWAVAMKKEVIKEAKKLEKDTPKAFSDIVDRVAKSYETVRSIDAQDLKRAVKELKANWEPLRREAKRTIRKISRAKATGERAK